MNYTLFFSLISILGISYLWIGKKASQSLESTREYFLSNRTLSFMPLALTLLATQLGGGTLLGGAQEAYTQGWRVLFYPLGQSLGLAILGLGFGKKLRELNVSTIAEIFEKKYRSFRQKYLASGLSIVTLFCILVAQAIAARVFFYSMGITQPYIFLTFWTILILYTVMGGFKAVVNTDILQALFIVAVCLGAFLVSRKFQFTPLETGIVQQNSTPFPWATWLLMPMLFTLIGQDMGQRCFAARNSRVIGVSALIAAFTLFLTSSVGIYFGVLYKKTGLLLGGDQSILIEAVRVSTPPALFTFFVVAVFLALASTADSLLCAISSNLACDFFPLKRSSDQSKVRFAQIMTLVIGVLSLGLAYLFNNVVAVLMFSYELSVYTLFVPIIMAIFSKSPSKMGSWGAIGIGALSFLAFKVGQSNLPKEILILGAAFVGYYVGKQLESKKVGKELEGKKRCSSLESKAFS